MRRETCGQKGFTLIELLIVIAIIGLIAAMLIPNLLDAMQKTKQKRTIADMRITGTALFSDPGAPGRIRAELAAEAAARGFGTPRDLQGVAQSEKTL